MHWCDNYLIFRVTDKVAIGVNTALVTAFETKTDFETQS